MKRRSVTAAEHDIVSRYWRRMLCYTQRAGVVAGIKRQMRRRERRDAKTMVRRQPDDA